MWAQIDLARQVRHGHVGGEMGVDIVTHALHLKRREGAGSGLRRYRFSRVARLQPRRQGKGKGLSIQFATRAAGQDFIAHVEDQRDDMWVGDRVLRLHVQTGQVGVFPCDTPELSRANCHVEHFPRAFP